jgi:hypothetical protein
MTHCNLGTAPIKLMIKHLRNLREDLIWYKKRYEFHAKEYPDWVLSTKWAKDNMIDCESEIERYKNAICLLFKNRFKINYE